MRIVLEVKYSGFNCKFNRKVKCHQAKTREEWLFLDTIQICIPCLLIMILQKISDIEEKILLPIHH